MATSFSAVVVQIPLALTRRGVNSWKILMTLTGVFLYLVQVGVIATKVFGSANLSKQVKIGLGEEWRLNTRSEVLTV